MQVAASGLISPNEELEDVATADLKYTLTDFYLGDLLMEMTGQAQRLARVTKGVVSGWLRYAAHARMRSHLRL
jgi:hypothetical protein